MSKARRLVSKAQQFYIVNVTKLTTCPAHATCTYEECSGLWYIESCEDGYVLDSTGMKCEEEDLCKNVTCGANAYCSEGKCYCKDGFEGDPNTGCTKVDPCDNVTCGTNAYCSNGKCYCNNGFEGDPYSKCTPIDNDPCKNVTCGANAYCSNGSCYCSYGYTGNPYTGCTKKDPCDDITCGVNAYCANGSCYCYSGYEGNPYSGCYEPESDPCDDVTDVSIPANAYCSSHYSSCPSKCSGWSCSSGYIKDGNSCKRSCTSDSCSGYSLSTCPSHGNCSSCTVTYSDCSTGSTKYKLDSCESGYTKSGNSCIQVCTAETCSGYSLSTCPDHGNCSSCTPVNTDCSTGSTKYKLDSCESGYTKSGNTCIQVCTAETCSGYGLSSCPLHGKCSSCTVKNSDCTTGSTKYKLDSCDSGYKQDGDSCKKVCKVKTCSSYTYPLTSCPEYGYCSICADVNSDCTSGAKRYKLDSCQWGYVKRGSICIPDNNRVNACIGTCPAGQNFIYNAGKKCCCPYGQDYYPYSGCTCCL